MTRAASQKKKTPPRTQPAALGKTSTGKIASSKSSRSSRESPAARWTFLTNHAHVLAVLDSNPELVLRQVAIEVGITERAVQRIIQDLEEGGFIVRERVGRQNRYQVRKDLALRHPIEAHRTIGDLLRLINK